MYSQFDIALKSTSKQDILINKDRVYGVVMNFHLSVGLIGKHFSKIYHSLATS